MRWVVGCLAREGWMGCGRREKGEEGEKGRGELFDEHFSGFVLRFEV